MTKIAHSIWVKICFILFALLSGICTIYSISAISFSINYNLFEQNTNTTYYDTQWCHMITSSKVDDVMFQYLNGMTPEDIQSYYDTQTRTNFSFELYDGNDKLLVSTPKPEKIGYETSFTFDTNYDMYEGSVENAQTHGTTYMIRAYVADPLTVPDSYKTTYSIFSVIFSLGNGLFLIAGISIVVLLFSLIYLVCVAGHRPKTDEIVLNVQDKIPLDIYCLIAFIGMSFCVAMAENLSWAVSWDTLELLGLTSALVALEIFCLASLLTLATRFKKGGFLKNTLCYFLLRYTWKIWKAVFSTIEDVLKALPVIWKVVLIWLGISLLYLLFSFIPPLTFLLNTILLMVLCTIAVQWQKLHRAGKQFAEGNLDYKIDTSKMFFTFKQHGENLNNISKGIAIALEQKMKSERLRTELITNVSHDIKTPLTSIINYVDLLKKENLPEQASAYVEVLDRQSHRLKKLTEDLVEASKASTGNIQCHLVPLDIVELVQQSIAEYSEKLENAYLEPIVNAPENEPVFILADGNLMWRVLSNLLNNACKYSQPNTRVYLQIKQNDDNVWITVKNISRDQLNVAPEELMERFVRGDSSRSTEGSGLGLNIARSLVELQKGKFMLSIDGDLFKAQIRCIKANIPQQAPEPVVEPVVFDKDT